jgi:hypothetical protein
MRCPRCKGLMVNERFQDVRDDTGQIYFEGFRCLVCGEILDPLIVSNRKQPAVKRGRRRKLLPTAA